MKRTNTSKKKVTIKASEKMTYVMGKLILLYGDSFADWLNKNMKRLVKEWQDETH